VSRGRDVVKASIGSGSDAQPGCCVSAVGVPSLATGALAGAAAVSCRANTRRRQAFRSSNPT